MPRFFFDVHDNGLLNPDDEGGEFVSREQGQEEAIATLTTLAKDKLPQRDDNVFSIDMRDAAKQVIYTVSIVLTAHWTD